jgi:hypothetical protein
MWAVLFVNPYWKPKDITTSSELLLIKYQHHQAFLKVSVSLFLFYFPPLTILYKAILLWHCESSLYTSIWGLYCQNTSYETFCCIFHEKQYTEVHYISCFKIVFQNAANCTCISRATKHAITCSNTEISNQALGIYVMVLLPTADRHR